MKTPMKTRIARSALLLAMTAIVPLGQASPDQPAPPAAPAHGAHAGGLIAVVREVTQRYKDVSVALADGYAPHFGCVSGGDEGAMGVHLVNGALVADGVLDPTRPELLLYEPVPGGGLRLTGADYLVLADAWDANNADAPVLMGHLLHLFDSPNRFRLPPFYTLHVWAWKSNPHGNFANWNPRVSCDHFNPDAMAPH